MSPSDSAISGRGSSISGPQPPVGIDLGTTFSVLAYIDSTGRPVTVPNGVGDLLTPSAVFFDDNDVIVGREARKSSVINPDAFAECFKRDMGIADLPAKDPRLRRAARGAQRLRPRSG